MVIYQITGTPGGHENGKGDDDGKPFRNDVKEKIVVQAGQVKAAAQQGPNDQAIRIVCNVRSQ